MKKLISLILALSMLFALAIPAMADPNKTNGYTPSKNTYGAVATAEVIKQNGNTNTLNITVTIDNVVVAADSFAIKNNSAGEFTVGDYKVYVSTYGNTKIDTIFITDVNEICVPAEEIPYGTSVSATGIKQNGYITTFINVTVNGAMAAFGSVSIAPNSSGVFNIGGYKVYVSTYDDNQIYAVITDAEEPDPTPVPTSTTYLVRNATSNGVQVSIGEGSPSPSNGNYAIWWNTSGNSNNPEGTTRYIQFEVTVDSEGWYQLDWMWNTRGNDMFNHRHMSINGGEATALPFRGSQSNTWEYFPCKVELKEGKNTIKIWWWETGSGVTTNSWLILDHLKVTAYDGIAERDTFWSDFVDVLTLGTNTLSIADASGINAALAAYDNLTGAAQTLLANEKSLLDVLKAKIIELEIKHDQILSDFGFTDILSLNVTSLNLANADRLYAALAAYASLPESDKPLLAVEKSLLDTLKARMELLEDGNTAAIMLEDWLNAYLKDRGNGVYSTYLWSDKSASGEETGFWQAANVYEVLNDAYEATDDQEERATYKMYMDGYRVRFLDGNFSWSGTWKNNEYTDDLLWWANAFTRTYMLTGDESYLTIGEEIFTYLYARAWDTRTVTDSRYYSGVQGGLLWKFNKSSSWTPGSYPNESNNSNEKNIATNGNGTIAAARLARIYENKGDTAKSAYYANIAYEIYDWMYKSMVADYTTGKLWDNFQSQAGKQGARDWQFSYNYGLFAGAAYEMWINTGDGKYLSDAKLVLNYGWITLTMEDGLTFKNEGGMDGGDGASFRLVFARYTGLIVKNPEFAEFEKYMIANAHQTWSVRRSSDGLVGESSVFATDNGTRIPSPIAAYGVLMQLYSDFNPNITYGFEDDLVFWKVGYKSLEEAAGDKVVNMKPIFIAGGSGFGASEGPEKLFDYITTGGTGYAAGTGTKYGGGVPYWAEWRYEEAFVASRLIFATANDNMSWPRRMGDGWTLSGSNDGENWEILYTGKADDYSNFNRMFYAIDLPGNTTAYSHYKLNSPTGGDGGSVQLSVVALASDPVGVAPAMLSFELKEESDEVDNITTDNGDTIEEINTDETEEINDNDVGEDEVDESAEDEGDGSEVVPAE